MNVIRNMDMHAGSIVCLNGAQTLLAFLLCLLTFLRVTCQLSKSGALRFVKVEEIISNLMQRELKKLEINVQNK